MFINAEPRIVSNGFETFVPFHRVESSHQRLVEMTNNDVNAWSVYRPVASSTSDHWGQHIDDFGNEILSVNQSSRARYMTLTNCQQVQSPYGGYFQEASLAVPRQPVDYPKTSYAHAHQIQYQPSKKPTASEQSYQNSGSDMNCLQKQSPMLSHDYPQWSLGRGRGSFAEFSRIRNVLKDFPCQTSIESNPATFASASSSQLLESSYQEETLRLGANFNLDRTSPSTVHSSYSPLTTSVNPQSLIADLDNSHSSSTKTGWWPESLRDDRDGNHGTYGFPLAYDGLPKCQAQQPQQQYSNQWNAGTQAVDDWTAQAIASTTISPKVLTLNVSSAPLSSSVSSQGAIVGLSASCTVASSSEDVSDSGPDIPAVIQPQQPQLRIHRQRQILPDAGPISRRIVPVLPSNDYMSNRNTKKRSTKIAKSGNHTRGKASPVPITLATAKQIPSRRAEATAPRSSEPKRIEPKPASPTPPQSYTNLPQSSSTAQATHHRDAKDDFLVKSKLAGMSYKEIRRQGKFSEAESTLRGRFRTLTKHKAARVRKPEWEENDVSPLCSADCDVADLKIDSTSEEGRPKAD